MSSPRAPLASVYLNRQRVGLLGDPRPRVAKVLAASGAAAEGGVTRVDRPDATRGRPMGPEEVIDRTERPEDPIYLVAAAAPRGARPRQVAFPNPGSPLPRLRGIRPPPDAGARPYLSRPAGPRDRPRLRRL